MASKKMKRRRSGDEDADYKSAYTEGVDGASTIAPTEYSGLPDYKSSYNTDDNASVFTGVTTPKSRKAVASKKTRQRGDDKDADYRSAYTEGMDGASTIAPTEHSGLPDYQSAYNADENASVITGATKPKNLGTRKAVASRKTRQRRDDEDADYRSAYTEGMDGASSIAPTEYSGLPDYQSAYNADDNASVFSKVTGAESFQGSKTSKSKDNAAVVRGSKKDKIPADAATDYVSSYSEGKDGAETISPSDYGSEQFKHPDYASCFDEAATIFTDVTGASDVTKTSRRSRRRKQPSEEKVNEPVIDVIQESPATFAQIPIICHTDVDALGDGNVMDSDGASPGSPKSVYSTVYLGDIKAPDPKPSPTDASMYGPMYSGEMEYDGGCSATVYDAFQNEFVRKSWFDNLHFSQLFIPHLHSDDWIVYAFIFLTCMLVGCFGSFGYLFQKSPVGEDREEFVSAVEQIQLELEEIKQKYTLAMQEAVQIFNETQEIALAFDALKNDTDNLLSQNQQIGQLVSRIQSVGKTPSTAIRSCASLPPYYNSGYYYISSRHGSPVRLYCDREFQCNGISGGWTRVAGLVANNRSEQCPTGLETRIQGRARYCSSQSASAGCTSIDFGNKGIRFSEVCGRVLGLQLGTPNAFLERNNGINGAYVDGISITHGRPRKHIWTFAASLDETSQNLESKCPCTYTGNSNTRGPPSFVGNNYFCDTGASNSAQTGIVYTDTLWDGDGCSRRNTCCNFNSPPWFYRKLPEFTADDVEMRVCRNALRKTADVLVSMIDIYVR